MFIKRIALGVALVAALIPGISGYADEDPSAKDARMHQLEQTVQHLQETLGKVQAEMKDMKAKTEMEAAKPRAPQPALPTAPGEKSTITSFFGGGRAAGSPFDFGIVGNVRGRLSSKGEHDGRPNDAFSFTEAELNVGGNIDPYSRADLVIAFPDRETPEVEEGYVTWEVPFLGLDKLILGRTRAVFGKLNGTHAHNLPQSDFPLVIRRFFGDEGLSDTGITLQRTFDLGFFSQLTYTLGNGDNGTAFDNRNQSQPMHLAHLKNFWDVGDHGGLEFGLSGAHGAQDRKERNAVRYGGMDLAYKWKLGNEKSFRFGTEGLWMQRQRVTTDLNVTDINVHESDERKFGMYSFVEYQWSQRWAAGLRYDYTQVPGSATDKDKEWALTPGLTLFQSEFNRLRLEFSHSERTGADDLGGGFQNRDSNSVTFQVNFLLGTHKPHNY